MNQKTQKYSGNISPRTSEDDFIKYNNKRCREWAITAWKIPIWDDRQMKYLIFGEEICPTTGKLHWQTYVYFYNAKKFTEVQKYFFKKGENRIAQCKGEPKENIAYCSKDDKFVEFGEAPAQGKRTDLADLAATILNGNVTVKEIRRDDPHVFHLYGRTLNALEDDYLESKFRQHNTKGIWYYGKTGTGKSHKAFEDFHPDTHYLCTNDLGWWEGYRGQETVIINDFRGWIPYDEMLQMVDKWPYSVRRRGRAPMPFTSKTVIITSALTPEECYHNRHDKDDIKQLLRRFEIINLNVKKVKQLTGPNIAYF